MSVQNRAAQVSRLRRLKETLFGSTQAPFELPVVRSCAFDTTRLAHAAGVSRLAELGRREVRELDPSILADTDLFFTEVRNALEHRGIIWLIGPINREDLKRLAGSSFCQRRRRALQRANSLCLASQQARSRTASGPTLP